MASRLLFIARDLSRQDFPTPLPPPPPKPLPVNLKSTLVNAPAHPPNAFIRPLPKAELHLPLEGAIELATLQEPRERPGDPATAAEAEQLYLYQDFPGFLL